MTIITPEIFSENALISAKMDLFNHFIENFLVKEDADRFFQELKTLPFFTPTLKIRGKDVKPRRQDLAYGDSGVSYSFSGTTFTAIPCTPLILELRNKVEKLIACTCNFVLLNLYPDGNSYINHHKDNESDLDATFPISVLSFGAERKIEFKKTDTPITSLELKHGSFYSMLKPTNDLFTHGIPPQSCYQRNENQSHIQTYYFKLS